MKNLYLRLRVAVNASPEEIKRAYHQLAREAHPDSGSGDTDRFVALREAYTVLSDPGKRGEYDSQRAQWAKQVGAIICVPCGTANVVKRRPRTGEQVVCAHCQALLPLDVQSAVALQKQRLISEAARVVDDVGAELASAAADVLKAQINKLRRRWVRN